MARGSPATTWFLSASTSEEWVAATEVCSGCSGCSCSVPTHPLFPFPARRRRGRGTTVWPVWRCRCRTANRCGARACRHPLSLTSDSVIPTPAPFRRKLPHSRNHPVVFCLCLPANALQTSAVYELPRCALHSHFLFCFLPSSAPSHCLAPLQLYSPTSAHRRIK